MLEGIIRKKSNWFGKRFATLVLRLPGLKQVVEKRLEYRNEIPGRLFTFLAVKP